MGYVQIWQYFLYLQSITQFKWLKWHNFSICLPQKGLITVPEEKRILFNFFPWILKDLGHIKQPKILYHEVGSLQSLGYQENDLIILS